MYHNLSFIYPRRLQMQSQKSQIEKTDHITGPVAYNLANTAQDAAVFPSHMTTLLAQVPLLVLQDCQALFRKAASPIADPQPALLHEFLPFQMQYFVFAFTELHGIPISPFLQPVN